MNIDVFLFEVNTYPSFCPLRKGELIKPLNEVCKRHYVLGLCRLCKDISIDSMTK